MPSLTRIDKVIKYEIISYRPSQIRALTYPSFLSSISAIKRDSNECFPQYFSIRSFTSSKYSGAYIQAIPQVKCSNTGSFSWLSRTAPEKVHGNLYYSFYSNGNKWSGDAKSKTTTYTWKWYALKLPTGASGGSTQVGSGTKKATFTYNSSTKKLSVQ